MSVLPSVRGGAVHNLTFSGRKGRTLKIDKLKVEGFIREKVEKEAWTDEMIACELGIKPSTANHWRNKLGIKPANKFRRNFKEKYGSDAIDIFHTLVKSHAKLREIGAHFGFTREYARQVHNQFFQVPISGKTKTRRRAKRKLVPR